MPWSLVQFQHGLPINKLERNMEEFSQSFIRSYLLWDLVHVSQAVFDDSEWFLYCMGNEL